MIFFQPPIADGVDQGDIIDGCPTFVVERFDANHPLTNDVKRLSHRVYVLTQTCDLANVKATSVAVAEVLDAQDLVAKGLLKQADVQGPIRAGRVFGWYFLPKHQASGLPESIVDLRHVHTIRRDLLTALCQLGQRRARLLTPYREHLAQHFALTYARIGLPEPYPTD